jgi:hypothetical protein
MLEDVPRASERGLAWPGDIELTEDLCQKFKKNRAYSDVSPQLALCFKMFGAQCSHFEHFDEPSLGFRCIEPDDFLLPSLGC